MVVAPVKRGGPTWILAIESSCDDTSVAVLRDGHTLVANVNQTQATTHAAYGGIVPEAASRIHAEVIDVVCHAAVDQAEVALDDISAIAVTIGPGLPGSLLVGVEFARGLAQGLGVPLIPVNHLEGHVAAAWLDADSLPQLPAIALIVSGGHTELVKVQARGQYSVLGRTRDDAAGEAFDKVARMLGLGFPGGPAIEIAASQIINTPFQLPRAWIRGTSDFSFSGLKSSVRRLLEDSLGPEEVASIVSSSGNCGPLKDAPYFVNQVALAFEEAVVDVLVAKTVAAAYSHKVDSIILTGGVAANSRLRRQMSSAAPVSLHVPDPVYCTDNAAMIGVAGAWTLARGDFGETPLSIEPGLQLA